jgi:F-type H+-transporting ATPase subunit b
MLDIDLVTIVAEILNFIILAVGLYFLLFKPIIKRMEKSAEQKAASLAAAEEKERHAAEKLADIEERLANIDNEIDIRLQEAYKQAQAESEALLEITQKEAEKILLEAEIEAERRQQQEIEELHEELVNTILNISGQVLIKSTPVVIHDNLVDELIEEIWDLGKRDMRQVRSIRESLADRTPTVQVASANELSPDQQRTLIRTFSALADRNVNMEIDIQPDLISGIRVRMGDLVVENTLAMELAELSAEVSETLQESISNDE